MVVRMRSTRSHTANRRSHHKLMAPALIPCPECGSPKVPHMVCEVCGKYDGKQIIDVHAKLARKEKRAKEKAKVAGK